MKKLTIKLQGHKVTENEEGDMIANHSKVIKVTVESRESDAFLENGAPDTDWLEMLAEKQLNHYFEMMTYEIIKL